MITIDAVNAVLHIEDIGVTLRSLLAYAATGYKTRPKRSWKVVYKNVVIANIRLKTTMEKSNDKP